jgi:integrase
MRTITLNLNRRKDGLFQKKIDGQLHYFGRANGSESQARKELIEFLRLRENGVPQVARADVPLHEIANRYAADVKQRVQPATFDDYDAAIKSFVSILGRDTCDTQLTASHFGKVRDAWDERFGSVRLGNQIQAIRTMFRWAVDNLIIERIPAYGNRFDKPTATEQRIEARATVDRRGHRKFSAGDIAKILAAAKGDLKTFVLLALNGGMYSVDISDLAWEHIKNEGNLWIVDRLRAKTKIPQRFPMWPEVAKRFATMHRSTGRIFSTVHGNAWNNRRHKDSIALTFRRLVQALGIHRKGVGFGSFRHTHVSAVGDHSDGVAARVVRGHLVEGVVKHYDIPENKRLKSVTDLARRRLLNTAAQQAAKVAAS